MSEEIPNSGDVTRLLCEWRSGDAAALEEVVPWIYRELHGLAASYLRNEREGHTLQPTALVNELYLRMAEGGPPAIGSRRHFYGIAARLMRQILVDHARKRLAEKRGSGAVALSLDEALTYSSDRARDFEALDAAIEELAKINMRGARVVELRFFAGLSVAETASLMEVSESSVFRDLRFALAFLADQLSTA